MGDSRLCAREIKKEEPLTQVSVVRESGMEGGVLDKQTDQTRHKAMESPGQGHKPTQKAGGGKNIMAAMVDAALIPLGPSNPVPTYSPTNYQHQHRITSTAGTEKC